MSVLEKVISKEKVDEFVEGIVNSYKKYKCKFISGAYINIEDNELCLCPLTTYIYDKADNYTKQVIELGGVLKLDIGDINISKVIGTKIREYAVSELFDEDVVFGFIGQVDNPFTEETISQIENEERRAGRALADLVMKRLKEEGIVKGA